MSSVDCLIITGIKNVSAVLQPPAKTIGAYRIATELRQAGFSCQVADISTINPKMESLFFSKIVDKFVGPNTLWVGFSSNFILDLVGYPQFEDDEHARVHREMYGRSDEALLKFMAHCRKKSPNIQFVVGGVKLYDVSEFGFYEFQGHVDRQIVEFTVELSKGNLPSNRVIYNKEFSDFCTSRTVFTDQDMLIPEHTLPIEIARGCIFKCKFCAFPLNGKTKGAWVREPEILLEEMHYNFEKYGIEHYIIVDDTFNDSIPKLEMLQDKVFSRLPFRPTFSSYLRLDLMLRYPHSVDLLKEIGIKSATFGIETMNPLAAKLIGKGTDPWKQIEFLHKIKQDSWKDINLFSGFIMGFEGQNKKELLDFSEWLLTEDNPLNGYNTNTLGLREKKYHSKMNTLYFSEFDLTVDQSNYEFYRSKDGKKQWRLKSSDIDSEWVNQLKFDIDRAKYDRPLDRVVQFQYSQYYNLGIPHDKLTSLTTRELDKQENVKERILDFGKSYFRELLK